MKTTVLKSLSLAAILILLTACGKEKDYRTYIPANAKAVLAVDACALAAKGGLQEPEIKQDVHSRLQSLLGEEDFRFFEELLKDPTEAGIAWDKPLYVFHTSAEETALLAKVEDRDEVKSLLQKVGKRYDLWTVDNEDGFDFVNADEYGIVFNEDALVLLLNNQGKTKDNIRLKAAGWLQLDASDSFIANKDFAVFDENRGDMTAWVSLGVVPDTYKEAVQLGMPRDVNLDDWHYLVVCNFEKGKAVMDIQMCSANEAATELYEGRSKMLRPIQGEFFPDVKAEPCLWLGLSADGKALYEELISNANLSNLLEGVTFGFDIQKFISTIQGDFVLQLPHPESSDIIIRAQMKNDSVLHDMEQLTQVMTLLGADIQKDGAKGYSIRTNPASLVWVGVDEQQNFYYTSSKDYLKPAEETPAWTAEVPGYLCYLHIDIRKAVEPWAVGHPLSELVLKVETAKHSTLEVRMTDTDENSWKQLVKTFFGV